MGWFRRHLTWVAVLSFAALYPLGFITGTITLSINPYISTGTYYAIVYIIGILWLFVIDGWVLRRKNRSLGHLLWLIIPFGWIVFLLLENRSGVSSKEVGND